MTRKEHEALGGSAFPTSVSADTGGGLNYGSEGMTLRDWFAGKALEGMLSGPKPPGQTSVRERLDRGEMYTMAYEHADAMLEARKPKTEKGETPPKTDKVVTGPPDLRTSTNAHQGMPFVTWKSEVDRLLVEKSGMSSDDMPDFGYWDAYDSGESPGDAADDAIRNAHES